MYVYIVRHIFQGKRGKKQMFAVAYAEIRAISHKIPRPEIQHAEPSNLRSQ